MKSTKDIIKEALQRKIRPFESVKYDLKRWQNDNTALISAPTGCGKTTFILNEFCEYVINERKGKVLILVPRKILKEQMENIVLGKDEEFAKNVLIMTYQAVEKVIQDGKHDFLTHFGAIVCDEAHYFIEDSSFNPNTLLSYECICRYMDRNGGIVIFQSATLGLIPKALSQDFDMVDGDFIMKNSGISARDFEHPIRYVYEYNMEQKPPELEVRYLVNESERLEILKTSKGKSLCFVSNKKRGEELCKALAEGGTKCMFVTAENKEEQGAEAVSSLVDYSKFPSSVLIATSVLDVGVNIHDEEVSTIILDTCDRTTFLQMLGRIRLTENQDLTVYIFKRDATYFRNWIKTLKPRLEFQAEMARVPEEKTASRIVYKLTQEHSYVDKLAYCFDSGKMLKLNRLLGMKLKEQLKEYQDSIEGLEEDGEYFIKKQLGWLGQEDSVSIDNYAEKAIRKQIKEELAAKIRKELDNKDGLVQRKEMAEQLSKLKSDIRRLDKSYLRSNDNLSIPRFNQICYKERLPFKIMSKKIGKTMHYWLADYNTESEPDE